jgi:hypothetical protein
MPVAPASRTDTFHPESAVNVNDVYLAELTSDEAVIGFTVHSIAHPAGLPVTISAVAYIWGDPSHRLIKTRGRDGIVYQLQAFGRRSTGNGTLDWFVERYWPGCYGPRWVLDRLLEHIGRPGYRPLIELHIPPPDPVIVCDAAASLPAAV